MSKEIRDIIAAFRAAEKAGRKTALATIVHVEGSSYRMPGARMLVDDNGCLTGAISGGCLEGDARRRALLAIHEGKNRLVTYDTSNDDDVEFVFHGVSISFAYCCYHLLAHRTNSLTVTHSSSPTAQHTPTTLVILSAH